VNKLFSNSLLHNYLFHLQSYPLYELKALFSHGLEAKPAFLFFSGKKFAIKNRFFFRHEHKAYIKRTKRRNYYEEFFAFLPGKE